MKEIFKDAKIGDKVWSFIYGWGVIQTISECSSHPIAVEFQDFRITFSYKGKRLFSESQTLFWNEFQPPAEAYIKPLPELPVDTKVLVWDNCKIRACKRYFAKFDNLKIVTFDSGATSFSTNGSMTSWDNWELYEEG